MWAKCLGGGNQCDQENNRISYDSWFDVKWV